MSYTVWKDGRQIGRTRFEHSPGGERRAGIFLPSEHGLTVLPDLTAMLPALLAFAERCRREGISVDDDSAESGRAALDAFGETPEGQAVIRAAKHVAGIELRDPRGRTMVWESILISDLAELRDLASETDCASDRDPAGSRETTYFISATLAPRLRPAFDERGVGDTPMVVS